MPRYYVTYGRTYVINANDEDEAMATAEFDGKQIDGDIFLEEVDDE